MYFPFYKSEDPKAPGQLQELRNQIRNLYATGYPIVVIYGNDLTVIHDLIETCSDLGTIKAYVRAEKEELFKDGNDIAVLFPRCKMESELPDDTVKVLHQFVIDYLVRDNENYDRKRVWMVVPNKLTMPLLLEPYVAEVSIPPLRENEIELVTSEVICRCHTLDKAPNVKNTQGYRAIQECDDLTKLAVLLKGMSRIRIQQLLYRISLEFAGFYNHSINTIEIDKIRGYIDREKEEMLKSGGLSIIKVNDDIVQPVGFDKISEWIKSKPECDNMLLEGLPGTGKTLCAQYIAKKINRPLFSLPITSILEKYVGASEKRFAAVLQEVESFGECVLLIDEFEKYFSYNERDNGTYRRIMGQFLQWLQDKNERKIPCIVIALANSIEQLPRELFRNGRFNQKFCVYLPTADTCAKIFATHAESHWKNLKTNINYENWTNEFLGLLENGFDSKGPNTAMQNKNKFFTGADIGLLVDNLDKIISKEKINFESLTTEKIRELISSAAQTVTTEGENMKHIVTYYERMKKDGFESVGPETGETNYDKRLQAAVKAYNSTKSKQR